MSRKGRSKRPRRGCVAVLSLPFLAYSGYPPGQVGQTKDEADIEQTLLEEALLASIAERQVAPKHIELIERAESLSVEGLLDAATIESLHLALAEVAQLHASPEDKEALTTKLQSLLG